MTSRRGTTAVEAALVLPVLLFVLFAALDWGWYLYQWNSVNVAANRGIRLCAGATEAPEADAEAAVCAQLETLRMNCADGEVESTLTADASGPIVRVELTMPFRAPVGLAGTPATLHTVTTSAWYGWIAS